MAVKILVVDDEELVRVQLKDILEPLGYAVVEAADGREALAVFDSERPDIIFTDLRMPVMDGMQLLAELRNESPDVPIIMLSGSRTLRSAVEAVRLGAWEYILKPFNDPVDVELVIKRVLERVYLLAENRYCREQLEVLVFARTRQLRDSEERYRRLLDSVTDYVYTVTIDKGEVSGTEHRPGCAAVTGFTPEEYAADPDIWYRMIHEGDRQQVLAMAQAILTATAPMTIEHRIRHKDGSIRWVGNTLVPHRGENGYLIAYDGIVADITDKKRSEEEIREREERFRTLVANIPGAVYRCSVDAPWRMEYLSDEIFNISGRSPEEFLAKDKLAYADIVHPDDLGYVDRYVQEGVARREPYELEYRIRHTDGSIRWVFEKGRAFFGEDGKPFCLDGVIMDITERREAEEKLETSERHLADIINFLPDATIVIDKSGRVIAWNRACEELTGVSAPDILGKGDYAYAVPFYGAPRPILIDIALQHDTEQEAAYLNLERNGDAVAAEVFIPEFRGGRVLWGTARRLYDQDGRVVGAIESVRDITDRRRAEEEVRTLNSKLETRVAERTAELEQANRQLEAFAYSISHDLRAPLRHINGFTHLLLEDFRDCLNETGRDYLQRIEVGCVRMSDLIDAILSFSRFNRQLINKTEVDTAQLVREVVTELEREQTGRQVDFIIGALPPCHADLLLLRQVYTNLIGNAFKYTRNREAARIQIGSAVINGETVFCVRDNGAGFDMCHADRLFGVFQRLHRDEEFDGTGVGLAIVQSIISRHGGKVWGEGVVGEGAAFYFTLGSTGDQ